jgi:hypothetical protein
MILIELRFIHNWVITGIQWMVHWWVRVHYGPFFCVLPLVDKFQKKKRKLNITRFFYMRFQIDSQKYRKMHKLFKTFTFVIAIFGLSFLWTTLEMTHKTNFNKKKQKISTCCCFNLNFQWKPFFGLVLGVSGLKLVEEKV